MFKPDWNSSSVADVMGPINISSGQTATLHQLATTISKVLEKEVSIEFKAARSSDLNDSRPDNTLLRSLLPDFSSLSLEEGISKYLENIKNGLD